jgi:TRAP-type C4-dicarboxylate transport system permease small subunit
MGIEKLSISINRVIEYLLFVMGAGMALIVGAQVFSRYVLNHSIFWSDEAARFLLVWLTFLGAGVAYRQNGHASIDLLYRRFSPFGRKIAAIATDLLTLSFAAVMIFYGFRFAYFVRLQISPALFLPKWIPHSVIPIGGVILAVHALAFLTRHLQEKEF